MADYAFGIRENIQFMQDELPGLDLPADIADPMRYALARAKGRCGVVSEMAYRVAYAMGHESQLPPDIYVSPLVLRRDVDQLLYNLREQSRELQAMVSLFQRQYAAHPEYHSLASTSVLLHESVGNILYLRMRLRFLVLSELSKLMEVMEAA